MLPISNSLSTKKLVETGCKDSLSMKKLKISYHFWLNNSIDGLKKITSISPITCSWEKPISLWENVLMKLEWELETFLAPLPLLPPEDYWLNKIVMKFSLLFTLFKADNPLVMFLESPSKISSELLTCSTISPNFPFPSMMVKSERKTSSELSTVEPFPPPSVTNKSNGCMMDILKSSPSKPSEDISGLKDNLTDTTPITTELWLSMNGTPSSNNLDSTLLLKNSLMKWPPPLKKKSKKWHLKDLEDPLTKEIILWISCKPALNPNITPRWMLDPTENPTLDLMLKPEPITPWESLPEPENTLLDTTWECSTSKKTPHSMIPQEILFTECSMLLLTKKWVT